MCGKKNPLPRGLVPFEMRYCQSHLHFATMLVLDMVWYPAVAWQALELAAVTAGIFLSVTFVAALSSDDWSYIALACLVCAHLFEQNPASQRASAGGLPTARCRAG